MGVIASGLGPCRRRFRFAAFQKSTVFRERKREEFRGDEPPRQMRRQIRRKQPGVRPANDDVHPLAKQTVHKQLPLRCVLYLVEEQMLDRTIDDIDRLEDFIKVGRLDSVKVLVVEVDEPKRDSGRFERRKAENGLSATPHADYDLRTGTIQVDVRHGVTNQDIRLEQIVQVLFLVFDYCYIVSHSFSPLPTIISNSALRLQ